MIDEQQSEWKRHRWQKMNTRFLREETNKQLEIVKGLPDDVLTWDVYMGLHESITTIQVCCLLLIVFDPIKGLPNDVLTFDAMKGS